MKTEQRIALLFVLMVFSWMLISIGTAGLLFLFLGARSEIACMSAGALVYAGGLLQSLRWLERVTK